MKLKNPTWNYTWKSNWFQQKGEEKTKLLFVEEPGPDVLPFDARGPWTPSAHLHMADNFVSTIEHETVKF